MDLVIAGIALLASIGVAATLLVRQRARVSPEDAEAGPRPVRAKPTRQERILAKLEPLPEIPTLMDLVREEVTATGVENIPGHEGLAGPVMLKVFRRDHLVIERCTHDGYAFVIAPGVDPAEAMEDDVTLSCARCGPGADEEAIEDPGTDPDE